MQRHPITLAPEHQSAVATTSEQHGPESQWAVLAGLRFVLALLVVVAHIHVVVDPSDDIGGLYRASGFGAVLGFFLVSGYSISASIKRDSSTSRFYVRRFRRIYPPYLFALALTLIPIAIFGDGYMMKSRPGEGVLAPTPWQFFAHLLMLQQFASDEMTCDPVLWSLSIECFYYLLAPLFHRASYRVLLGITCASLVVLFVDLQTGQHLFDSNYFGTKAFLFAWAWLFGFLAQRNSGNAALSALVIGAGLFATQYSDIVEQKPWTGLVYVLSALVILNAHRFRISDPKNRAALNWLGDISYPIYLCHFAAFEVCSHLFRWTIGLRYVVAVIAVAALVDVLHKLLMRAIKSEESRRSILNAPSLRGRSAPIESAFVSTQL